MTAYTKNQKKLLDEAVAHLYKSLKKTNLKSSNKKVFKIFKELLMIIYEEKTFKNIGNLIADLQEAWIQTNEEDEDLLKAISVLNKLFCNQKILSEKNS